MPTDPSGNMRIGSDDEPSRTGRRIAVWAGLAVVIVLAAAGAWYFLGTDPARAEMGQAEKAARQSAEAGDYRRAGEALKTAIAKHPDRRDLLPPLEQLLAAVEEKQRQAKLDQDYNRLFQQGMEATQQNRWADALTAFEQAQAMRPTEPLKQLVETTKPRAEKARAAAALLTETRAAFTAGDFPKTVTLAQRGSKDFGDTNEAKEFAALRQQSEAKLAEMKAKQVAELEKQGDEAQKKGDLQAAQTAWQSARQLSDGPVLQSKLTAVAGQLKRYSDAVAAGKQLLQDARATKDNAKCANAIRRFEEAKAIRPGTEADSLLAEARNAQGAIQAALAAEAQARIDAIAPTAGKSMALSLPTVAATEVALRPTPNAQPTPAAQPSPGVAPAQTAEGFSPLFNGRDLSGWVPIKTSGWWSDAHQPVSNGWTAQQGELVCSTKEFIWLRTERPYGNFVLQLEFKLPRDGHTGVYVRCPDKGRLSLAGMEIEIIDEDFMPRLGATMNPARRYTGAIVGVAGSRRRATRPTGEWNSMEISCNGDLVQVTVNGTLTASANMSEQSKLAARPRAGYIGLVNWRGDANGCAFRNVRIKELPATAAGSGTAR